MSTSSSESSRFDPRRRRLCPDGACIGLLDDSGRCKVCGTVDRNAAAAGPPPPPSPAAGDGPLPESENDDVETATAAALDAAQDELDLVPSAGFDPGRRLCEDGACIGVVRPDGLCSVCGRLQGGG